MNQMLDAGQYSDDEIIQTVAQLDAEESTKTKRVLWLGKMNKKNASTTWKILWWTMDFIWGAEAGMMRLPAGVTDFVTGGLTIQKTLCKVSMTSLLKWCSKSWWYSWTDCWYSSHYSTWVGGIAPWNRDLLQLLGRGAVYGGALDDSHQLWERKWNNWSWYRRSALTRCCNGCCSWSITWKGMSYLLS